MRIDWVRIFPAWLMLVFIWLLSAPESKAQEGADKKQDVTEEIKRLVSYLRFNLNILGDPEISAREKDVIVNDSYAKIFRDPQVQIEDDLDQSRDVVTNKDVQAYLKDVDFFFQNVKFEFQINEIKEGVTQDGTPYYLVEMNRVLQGTAINGDSVYSVKERFIEINFDEENKDLKIVSIYTTKLSRDEELKFWWNDLPTAWRLILGSEVTLSGGVFLLDVWEIGDSTVMVKGQNLPDTFNIVRQLKRVVEREELNLSKTRRLYDLKPLNEFNKLKILDISQTDIVDLFPIRSLTTLEVLNCSSTMIEDLTPLKYCKSLKEIFIDNTPVHNIRVLSNFKNLEVIHMQHTVVDSLPHPRDMAVLREVDFSSTNLQNLDSIGYLKNLEYLAISNTGIRNIDQLAYLERLKHLQMDHTQVNDLTALSSLAELETVSFSYSQVHDLKPLIGLTSLKRIYCDGSQVSRDSFYEFYKRRPDCQVVFSTDQLTEYYEGLSEAWKEVIGHAARIPDDPSKEDLHEILKIKKIDISGNEKLSSLEPLDMLVDLRYLDISKTLVADLVPLEKHRSIEYLDASDSYITDLTPLKDLTNLKVLKCNGCDISDISMLEACDALDSMYFNKTSIGNIDVLNELPSFRAAYFEETRVNDASLVSLDYHEDSALVVYRTEKLRSWWGNLEDVWQNEFMAKYRLDRRPDTEALHRLTAGRSLEVTGVAITSLDPAAVFVRLKSLRFTNTRITVLNPVANLSQLEELVCSGNPITDIGPVQSLQKLRVLNIEGTTVEDLSPVANLSTLESLNCSGTGVKDLRPISGLQQLKNLEISNTKIRNISPLDYLTGLKELKCFNTSVSSKKIEQYRQSHPETEVLYY